MQRVLEDIRVTQGLIDDKGELLENEEEFT
jgi:hypothetical protein